MDNDEIQNIVNNHGKLQPAAPNASVQHLPCVAKYLNF